MDPEERGVSQGTDIRDIMKIFSGVECTRQDEIGGHLDSIHGYIPVEKTFFSSHYNLV